MKRASEIIRKCLSNKKMTQTQLAEKLVEDRRLVNTQLMRAGDFKFERFRSVINAIGFSIVIVDNDSEIMGEILETSKNEPEKMQIV